MNELIWFGGGATAAYLLFRHTNALAAMTRLVHGPSADAVPGSPWPSTSQQITKPAPPSLEEMPAPKPPAMPQLTGRWVWPVPRWQGRAPTISDGFGSPRGGIRHQGVDVMFARIASDPFPIGANGTKGYVMPEAWTAIAASDGVLWSADKSPRGWQVVIDHGTVATYYQHLSALCVPMTSPPAKGTPRAQMIQIKAGQPLGVIGADPLDRGGVKHLHFELWPAGPQSAIDPAPAMKAWEVLGSSAVGPLMARNLRNVSKREKRIQANREKYGDLVPIRDHFRHYPGAGAT